MCSARRRCECCCEAPKDIQYTMPRECAVRCYAKKTAGCWRHCCQPDVETTRCDAAARARPVLRIYAIAHIFFPSCFRRLPSYATRKPLAADTTFRDICAIWRFTAQYEQKPRAGNIAAAVTRHTRSPNMRVPMSPRAIPRYAATGAPAHTRFEALQAPPSRQRRPNIRFSPYAIVEKIPHIEPTSRAYQHAVSRRQVTFAIYVPASMRYATTCCFRAAAVKISASRAGHAKDADGAQQAAQERSMRCEVATFLRRAQILSAPPPLPRRSNVERRMPPARRHDHD